MVKYHTYKKKLEAKKRARWLRGKYKNVTISKTKKGYAVYTSKYKGF